MGDHDYADDYTPRTKTPQEHRILQLEKVIRELGKCRNCDGKKFTVITTGSRGVAAYHGQDSRDYDTLQEHKVICSACNATGLHPTAAQVLGIASPF